MKVLIVLVGVIAAASAVSFFELVHEEWKSFKVSQFTICVWDLKEQSLKFRLVDLIEN